MKGYRWLILLVFMLAAMVSQLLWLTFAPISSEIRKIYSVSAFDVSLLSMVWPIIFVLLAIPVGIFIDRHGFKKSVSISFVIMAIFSILRFLSAYPKSFILLLLSQTGAAISQPFIFESINKFSAEWFPEEEGTANGIATIGLFLGMMLALILTPMLYISEGIKIMLLVYAAISVSVAILFVLIAREKEGERKEIASFELRDLAKLSAKTDFLILEYGFFAGVGGFTALLTWLEEMLHSLHGIGIKEAGLAGGLMIIGGIFGSIVIPAISDKLKKIKIFILANLIAGSLLLLLLAIFSHFIEIAFISFFAGFFLMSALPLVLEICNSIAGEGMEARASSLLWFFSQVGSIVLIAVIAPVKEAFGSYFYPILMLSILILAAAILFMRVRSK